jgi:hypothetical protein
MARSEKKSLTFLSKNEISALYCGIFKLFYSIYKKNIISKAFYFTTLCRKLYKMMQVYFSNWVKKIIKNIELKLTDY